MRFSKQGGSVTVWHWYGSAAAGFSLLFSGLGLWASLTNLVRPQPVDFLSFWAAGHLVLSGQPSLAYDIEAHRAVERLVLPITGLLPFPYPPPFLTLVAPLALAPYGIAFIAWVVLTGSFYVFTAARLTEARYALANPPVVSDLLVGQTGFLTAGAFIFGLTLISSNPFVAGAVLGTLIVKPQLALLLPVAMLAGREWRVISGAVLSSSVLLLSGLIMFGSESYRAFFNILPHYIGYVERSSWPWPELVSPFAVARYFGAPQGLALLLHSVIAAFATALTARAWWLKVEERIPILAAATLLIPPYLFTYDALLLLVPMAWFVRERSHPVAFAAVWLCCLATVLTYFGVPAPNLIWLGGMVCLLVLHRDKSDVNQASGRKMGDSNADEGLITSA